MRREFTLAGALALTLVLAAAAVAGEVPDFSGKWVMDRGRSEGVPPDMEQTMTVAQSGDRISVETRVVSDQGDTTLSATYNLNGKEEEYKAARMGLEGKGKRTAKWAAEAGRFEVSEEETFEGPNGPVSLKFSRRWAAGADGKTLTIELDVQGPNGPQHSKRTFVKQ